MATFMTALHLKDGMTAKFQTMTKAAQGLYQKTEDIKKSLGAGVSGDKLSDPIRRSTQEQERFNKSVQDGDRSMGSLVRSAGKLVGAYIGLRTAVAGFQKMQDMSDQVSAIDARLKMINDGSQSLVAFNRQIFETANAARGSYLDMADMVGKLGTQAPGAFSGNDELIRFTDQLNKQYVISGATTQGMQAATLQLTQAMAMGVLRGEEFNSIFENAPTIMQAIAKQMGVPVGALRDLAAEGQITADEVKNALLNATEETNRKFEEMPRTWAQTTQIMRNHAIKAFRPVFTMFSAAINSDEFNAVLHGSIRLMYALGNAAAFTFALIGRGVQFGISMFERGREFVDRYQNAIIATSVVVGTVWLGAQARAMAGMVRMYGMAFMYDARLLAVHLRSAAATAAAWALAHWPLLVLAGIIGLVIYKLRETGMSAQVMAATFVGGIFYIQSHLQNLDIMVQNSHERIRTGASNVVKNVKYAFDMLWYGIKKGIEGALTFASSLFDRFVNDKILKLNILISGLNKIPKVNIPSISSINTSSKFSGMAGSAPKRPVMEKPEFTPLRTDADHWEARIRGYNWALNTMDQVGGKVKGFFNSLGPNAGEPPEAALGAAMTEAMDPMNSAAGKAGKDLKDIKDNTKKITDYLDDDTSFAAAAMQARTYGQIEQSITIEMSVSVEKPEKGFDTDGFVNDLAIKMKDAVANEMAGVVPA